MKKALLLTIGLVISVLIFGQQAFQYRDGLKECKAPERIYTNLSSNAPVPAPIQQHQTGGERAIVLRQLGTSGNGFGLLSVRQYVWADPAINAISFVHRMHVPPNGPGSGFIAYDYSIDGGVTWTNNVQVYEAPSATFNGRYPQGAIYNPAGNTDPTNAYYGYFAAVLDGSNGGTWGGYGYGTHQFATTATPTQHNVAASPEWLQGVPDAYTITSQGLAICVDPTNNGVGQPYQDYMILTKGQFNPEIGDFEMDRYLEYMPAGGLSLTGVAAGVADAKVAFSHDGQIGYIAYLSNNDENSVESVGCYHPILYKTIDGGFTWDGPYNVQLGGVDGLPVVLEYLTDELIETLFPAPNTPEREDIPFTSGFELGLTVDFSGNPHLVFDVGVGSQEWSIITGFTGSTGCDGTVAMIHVFSPNGGEDWLANNLGLMENFRGEFPWTGMENPSAEDNRPFVASTTDGTKLFFSWIDTNIENYEDNDQPDIYCVGYDVVNNTYSNTYIVTQFSAAWYSSFMAAGSKFVLDLGNGSYKVPFVYQQIDPLDLINPVQFWFVDNFILTDADLGLIQGVGEMETFNFSISQNYPNPCDGYTFIDVNTAKAATVNVEISNFIGQIVRKTEPQNVQAGKHQLRLNTAGLTSGVYLYTVSIDNKTISKKLIVK